MRKHLIGKVVSNRMQKTIVVSVERTIKNEEFGKMVRRTSKYKVHDENNECNIGDVVEIEETRPLSKDKNWKLVSIVRRNILTSEEEKASEGEGVSE